MLPEMVVECRGTLFKNNPKNLLQTGGDRMVVEENTSGSIGLSR